MNNTHLAVQFFLQIAVILLFCRFVIGLHAVFGAFIMGAAMPRGVIARALIGRIQPLTVALLLPLFFTYSGLNTKIGLQRGIISEGLFATLVIMAVVTTLMASPIFDRLVGEGKIGTEKEKDSEPEDTALTHLTP